MSEKIQPTERQYWNEVYGMNFVSPPPEVGAKMADLRAKWAAEEQTATGQNIVIPLALELNPPPEGEEDKNSK